MTLIAAFRFVNSLQSVKCNTDAKTLKVIVKKPITLEQINKVATSEGPQLVLYSDSDFKQVA